MAYLAKAEEPWHGALRAAAAKRQRRAEMTTDKIGGAPLLAAICVGVILFVFYSGNGEPEGGTTNKTIPASTRTSSATAEPRRQIDLHKPVMTDSYAIVCNQDLLIAAAVSRAAEGGMEKLHDAFTSIVGRSKKVREAGCEEWRAGIRLYNAHVMKAPFDEFIGFGVTPEGLADYFTMKSQLVNAPTEPLSSRNATEGPTGSAKADSEQPDVGAASGDNVSGSARAN
jgi:hypothetical protein